MENEATERPRGRRAARHSIGAAQHWRGRRGAAWLCAASATFSYPAGYGRGTNGRSVSAVNRKWVVGLLLSTPARFFHAVVGVGGVSLGQRGRHEERAGDDGEHLGLVRLSVPSFGGDGKACKKDAQSRQEVCTECCNNFGRDGSKHPVDFHTQIHRRPDQRIVG